MLKKYAFQFFQLGQALNGTRIFFEQLSKESQGLEAFRGLTWPGKTLGGFIRNIIRSCKVIGLPASLKQSEKINSWTKGMRIKENKKEANEFCKRAFCRI